MSRPMKPPPRIGVYARHSTAMQTATSSADQAAACQRLVDQLGGRVVETYLDPEMSGYRRDRPGLHRLLQDVRDGKIDIVVSEALDRLARDGEDVAWLGKKMRFARVEMHTMSEGHIDELKLAMASLMGAIFLKHLKDKTRRGLLAVIRSGRSAGGLSFGYRKVSQFDGRGEPINGLRDIDEQQAAVVQRIFRDFASGQSAIQIATRLNQELVPGPRGGPWNQSTIRGNPKKGTGLLNNRLYRGEVVWNRREWCRNPDSDHRGRVPQARDEAEWVTFATPELRIVDDESWAAVQAELARRARPSGAAAVAGKPRQRHLLSGLVRCSQCGSGYVISGKDYYRCASQKERGTCRNTVSVRKGPLETAVLAILKDQLLTEAHGRLFVEAFQLELKRLSVNSHERTQVAQARLVELEVELANFARHLKGETIPQMLFTMIREAEAEKAVLTASINAATPPQATATILPHPTLLALFSEKVEALQASLDHDAVRTEAAATLRDLIESVTIYPGDGSGPEAEVVASALTLMSFAANENSRRPYGIDGSSMAVVAGTGFDLCRTLIPLRPMQVAKRQ